MKNILKLFGVIAIVTVIGFSLTGCEDLSGDKASYKVKLFTGDGKTGSMSAEEFGKLNSVTEVDIKGSLKVAATPDTQWYECRWYKNGTPMNKTYGMGSGWSLNLEHYNSYSNDKILAGDKLKVEYDFYESVSKLLATATSPEVTVVE